MKFRLRFLIVFLSLVIVPYYFLANVLIKKSEDIVLGNFVNRITIIADIEKARILENIGKNFERLSAITSRTQLRRTLKNYLSNPTVEDKELMIKILSDAQSTIPDFNQVIIFDSRGQLVCTAQGDVPKDFDFKAVQERGLKRSFLTVEEDQSGKNKILLAGPLLLDNEWLGTLVIVSKPDSIAEITANFVNMGKTGEILIAKRTKDGDAQFVAPRRFENDLGAKRIIHRSQGNVPIIQALEKKEISIVDGTDYRDKKVLAVTRYIEPTDWGLVVKYDREEALAQIDDMRKVFWGIVGILLVFIFIIALIIAISIASPIEHMANVANKIKAGDLKAKVDPFVQSLDDEIGEFARTFSDMTKKLISFNEDLDAKVKEKTKELQESEVRLDLAVKGSRVGIWDWFDVNKNEEWWSSQFFELLGYKNNEIEPNLDNFKDLLHPDDRQRTFDLVDKHFKENKPFEIEYRLKTKTGSYRWFFARGESVRDKMGNPIRMTGTIVDITDAKEKEEKVNVLLRILDESPDFIGTADLQGNLLYHNLAARMLVGLPPKQDMTNLKISDMHPPWASKLVLETGVPAVFAQGSWQGETALLHRLGHEIAVSQVLFILRDEQGKPAFLATIIRDITHLKKIEKDLVSKSKELERSNQDLEQFAYVASHDLQEPLRMVASFTQLLERKYKDKLDEQAKEYIHFAVDGAKRMQGLIDDLLMFSKAGQKDVFKSLVDLNVVAQRVLKDLNLLLEENRAVVHIGPLPTLYVNETQMMQLFQNLISNGIKYRSKRDPIIKVVSRKIENDQWQFSVSDNGIGIEEKYFAKLFIIFQRLHTRKEYKGTGIGLALCKKIVENYGGRIWIESELEKGSTFYFTLKQEKGV